MHIWLCIFVAPTVRFVDQLHVVWEYGGQAQFAVVLSNPSSIDITIEVTTTDESATGNCFLNYVYISFHKYTIIILYVGGEGGDVYSGSGLALSSIISTGNDIHLEYNLFVN